MRKKLIKTALKRIRNLPLRKLRHRFLFSMILLITFIMGGVFFLVEKNDRAVILMEGKKRAFTIASHLAALSTSSLLLYDYTKLEQNVDEIAEEEEDVLYTMIIDKQGKVVAHSSRDDLLGKHLDDPLSQKAFLSPTRLIQTYYDSETGKEIWDVTYPVFQNRGEKWGTVRIGFSTVALRAQITKNRRDLIILTLAAIIVAIGAATYLADRITGPIKKLAELAISISRGDLNQEISIKTGDEIQELSEAFNSMTKDLYANREKQKKLIHQLSRKNLRLRKEIHARKQLEEEIIKVERLRALGEMSGGVAHDFNNILGAILGRAQLLLEKINNPLIKKDIKIIERAALDGAETVRRIQEFTTRRADRSSFTPIDINEIIKDSLEFTKTRWKNEAEAWGIKINVIYDLGKVPFILGNPSNLREVFTNLIINSVDAMPEGGTIFIKTYCSEKEVIIIFQDTGTGMPAEVTKRAFEPFFTTKGKRGSGLGLSICYGIISRHQGKIDLETEVGKGTTFNIYLPITFSDVEKKLPRKITAEENISARILIIDDDDFIREVLADTLTRIGFFVEKVKSGARGIELFSSTGYDIVLTDLGIGDMSGWDVAGQVKEISPSTPVALITGWDTPLSEEEIHKRGVDFVITKPFKLEELKTVFFMALNNTRKKIH